MCTILLILQYCVLQYCRGGPLGLFQNRPEGRALGLFQRRTLLSSAVLRSAETQKHRNTGRHRAALSKGEGGTEALTYTLPIGP
jgi:hypothetical protein